MHIYTLWAKKMSNTFYFGFDFAKLWPILNKLDSNVAERIPNASLFSLLTAWFICSNCMSQSTMCEFNWVINRIEGVELQDSLLLL